MRLSRKNSFIIAIVLVGLFILIGAYQFMKDTAIPRVELKINKEGNVEAQVVIGEFKRSESKDGKKLWDLYASEGRYYPAEGRAELLNPEFSLFKNNDEITVTAQKAIVHLQGTGVKKIHTIGSVRVHSQSRNVTLDTDDALIDKEQETLFMPNHVKIVGNRMVIEGDMLEGEIDAKNFKLNKNVITTIKPKEK